MLELCSKWAVLLLRPSQPCVRLQRYFILLVGFVPLDTSWDNDPFFPPQQLDFIDRNDSLQTLHLLLNICHLDNLVYV